MHVYDAGEGSSAHHCRHGRLHRPLADIFFDLPHLPPVSAVIRDDRSDVERQVGFVRVTVTVALITWPKVPSLRLGDHFPVNMSWGFRYQ